MTDPEFKIRNAELSDIGSIMALEEGSIVHPWNSKDIESLITDQNKKCLVAEANGEVVCYVGAETVLDECNIGNIVTAVDHRGKGYGAKVFTGLLNDLKNGGIAKVFLEVEHDNIPAISLYEKSGFTRYGYRRDYYGQGKDAVLMTKEL